MQQRNQGAGWPRSFDQGRRKNDAFTLSAALLTYPLGHAADYVYVFTQSNLLKRRK